MDDSVICAGTKRGGIDACQVITCTKVPIQLNNIASKIIKERIANQYSFMDCRVIRVDL